VPNPPDMSQSIRASLLGDSFVSANLPSYLGSLTVFTRRPVPPDAPYPMIVVDPDKADVDIGGLNFNQLRILADINVYGDNSTSANYRLTEQLGYAAFDLFHRNRFSVQVQGWQTARVWCNGPVQIPSDDDMRVGRLISLTAELVRLL
jgi:hypothetical protein